MSMMSPLDLTAIAPRVEPRGSSAPAKGPSGPTQDEAGALSFSGILEEKQELQKPRTERAEQGEKSEIAPDNQARPEVFTPSISHGVPAEGEESGTDPILIATAATPTSGSETTGQPVQTLPIPMTELMLRIKTGEIASPAQPESPVTPETGKAKDQTPAQPPSSGPTTATLEIKPTAGEGKAVPVVMTDQVKAAPAETTPAQPAVIHQAVAPKLEANQIQVPVHGSTPAEQAVQAEGDRASDAAPSSDQALQQPADAVMTGQVGQTDVKVAESSPRTEAAAGETQVAVEGMDNVSASTASESGQDAPQSQADQLTQKSAQVVEHYSTQAAVAENSPAPKQTSEQDVPAAPIPTASSTQPLDEGGFKVNTERTATPNQAQDIRQQVVRQLSTSLDGKIGQEKVVLHLNPEKLGHVEIQFVAKGNELNIVIAAQSGEAEKKAIREGIRELADGISDKSTRWQQVDIKVETRGQDAEKNDTRNDPRRDRSRRDQNSPDQQDHQHRRPDGRPDWASLRGEG